MHIALLLAFILLLGGAVNAEVSRVPIDRYDLTYAERRAEDPARLRDAWDHVHVVSALQGIVNRERPTLFLRAVHHKEGGDIPLDDWWLDKLRGEGAWLNGRSIEEIAGIENLVRRYRSKVNGLVVYDESVPATSNLASTIAGLNDFLPVRYDTRDGSLYRRLTEGLHIPVKSWLIQQDGSPLFTGKGNIPGTGEPSTGSPKNDAYRWAIAKFLDTGRCGTESLAYYIDAAWLKNPKASSFWNHTLTNHDYFISKRAFFFDLSPWDDEPATDEPGQPKGLDLVTMKKILATVAAKNGEKRFVHVGGFTPWAYKYTDLVGGKHDGVPTEWKTVEILSAYNAYLDADALSLSAMANASFFTHQPLPTYPPERERVVPPRTARAGAAKHSVAFYAGDWDSAAWLYQMLPTLWEDEKRGTVPMGWAFNPNLARRFPAAFWYTRKTRTDRDVFTAGDSGAGYVNPSMLEAPRPSDLPAAVEMWERHNREWYGKFGLSLTGFVIDGYAPPMGDAMIDAYARFSPDGTVAQKVPPLSLRDGMPLLRMSDDLPADPQAAAKLILSRLEGDGPSFRIFRAVLKRPSWYAEVAAAVEEGNPDAEIVDPYTLMARAKRHLAETGGAALLERPDVSDAMKAAGDNRPHLESALRSAPGEQREAMAFLIANMPERDLKALPADYLLENLRLAFEARREAPWGIGIPEDVFLNDLLPYASVGERRDNWRADFRKRFGEAVRECRTPSEAALLLNRVAFETLNVQYHATKRPKTDQSPYESAEAGYASCTGLSILLVDACRAVGVPARLVGTPSWTPVGETHVTTGGNHTWVEIWDNGWHILGASEQTALDDTWFLENARRADTSNPMHRIYAVSFRRTKTPFPMVWASDDTTVSAEDVTERYRQPAGTPSP